MANDQLPTPICILKMDINCCDKCPVKLKRKLLKSNGVKSVTVDSDEGMVTVSGDIDPIILLETVKKMGKEVELWFFQKETHKDKGIVHLKCATSDNDNKDENSDHKVTKRNNDKHFDQNPQHKTLLEMKARNEDGCGFWGLPGFRKDASQLLGNSPLLPTWYSNVHQYPQRLLQPVYRPVSSYQQSRTNHRLTPAQGYYMLLPPLLTYPYFQSLSPPRVNPMVHYTSYADNYNNL